MHSIVDMVLNKTKAGGIALAAAAALALTGCGGGDSVVGGGAAVTTVTGQFVDAPVDGLGYKCGTSTEMLFTKNEGMFTCNTDDKVAFYVGNLLLGSVDKVQTLVTPLDLVSISINDPVTTANTTVTNIVRFLMSISNSATSTTLTIDRAVFDEITLTRAATINFATATTALDDLIRAVKLGATVYTGPQATAHLEKSVNALFAGDYSGKYIGSAIGDWSITIDSAGLVTTGTATDSGAITGHMTATTGTGSSYEFAGESGGIPWRGTLNLLTKQFSGDWNDGAGASGTFTGKATAPAQPPATSGGNGGTLIVSGITPSTGNGNFSLPIALETAAGGTSTDKRVEFTDATTATRTLRLYYSPGTGNVTAIQYDSPAGNLGCRVDDVVVPCDTTKITFSASGKSITLNMAEFKSGTAVNGALEGYFTW